jgi:hypothetical protein
MIFPPETKAISRLLHTSIAARDIQKTGFHHLGAVTLGG